MGESCWRWALGVLVALCALAIGVHGLGRGRERAPGACSGQRMTEAPLTAFWINLNSSTDRREYMSSLLGAYGITHVRIPAFTPSSPDFKPMLLSLEKPCKRNSDIDVAVIMSHLRAIHAAVYHDPNEESPYALVLEDDVRFLFSINFTALVRSAPKDFGVLQLTTSNTEALDFLWTELQRGQAWYHPHWRNTTRDKRTYLFWSAQAYVIQKRVVKAFIDDVVVMDAARRVAGFRIHNSFEAKTCQRTRTRPCVVAYCLFADSYIYAGAAPAYVSTVSLVTGGRVGWNSTIHQLEVGSHRAGFSKIRALAGQVKLMMRSAGAANASGSLEHAASGAQLVAAPPFLHPLLPCA